MMRNRRRLLFAAAQWLHENTLGGDHRAAHALIVAQVAARGSNQYRAGRQATSDDASPEDQSAEIEAADRDRGREIHAWLHRRNP